VRPVHAAHAATFRSCVGLMPLPLPTLPPLLETVRKNAIGIPMPSKSVRIPADWESHSRKLARLIGCSHSAVLRLALQLGLERISEAISEAQEAAESNLEAREQALDSLEAYRVAQISTEIDAAWEGLADG
jgi:hypothetical protein